MYVFLIMYCCLLAIWKARSMICCYYITFTDLYCSSFSDGQILTGHPTYMFFQCIRGKKTPFFFKKIQSMLCPFHQCCMSNLLLSQHRPSIKSVTRAIPRERSCKPDVHHTLSPRLTPRQRHGLLFHTGALPSSLLQKREPLQCHSTACKGKYQLLWHFKEKGKQICCSLPTQASADTFGCI